MINMQSFLFCVLLLSSLTCALSLQKSSTKSSPRHALPSKKFSSCPNALRCVPPIQCPANLRLQLNQRPQTCSLPGGSSGYCCTSGQNHTVFTDHTHHNHISRPRNVIHEHDVHDRKEMKIIFEEARAQFANLMHEEKEHVRHVQSGHPESFHNMLFRSSETGNLKAIDLCQRAMERVIASRIYKKRERISNEDFMLNQVDASLDGSPFEQNVCMKQIVCPPTPPKYRTENGECNNYHPLRHSWGASGFPMQRLLPPAYQDGIWEPRRLSVHGTPLTNVRTISNELLADVDRPHPAINLLFMQFGQLITHDVTQSVSITTADGKSIRCCSEDGSTVLEGKYSHFACMPIVVEPKDPFYSQFNQRCINFVRSSLAPDNECRLGYGKQISQVTHYLDGSAIYGSDLKSQSEVRAFQRGLLRMSDDFGRAMLPLTNDKKACGLESTPCFFTGDTRSNQIISLTALHTLFAREHNRVALILGQLNPHWSDDTIFFETRSIVIAELQNIVYREYLPLLIGQENMERFDLCIRPDGYSNDYDENINACVTSEFATAAFRFGHSTVDGRLIIHNGPEIEEVILIPDVMFNSARLRRRHFYDEILNTMLRQPMQQVDSAITYGLTRFLFRTKNPFGLDLAAINMHRSRDHGVRPYNDYLEATGHQRVMSFDVFGPEIGSKLAKVYSHPDDIDLWIGGLLEGSKGDSIVGSTFSDIIADQFSRFRRGDRYFFEHNPNINPGAFTPTQLQQIRLSSMARIICDNADGFALSSVSPRAFVLPHVQGNAATSCADSKTIPILDYSHWKQ